MSAEHRLFGGRAMVRDLQRPVSCHDIWRNRLYEAHRRATDRVPREICMKPASAAKSAVVAFAVMAATMPAFDVALGQGGPMPVTVANPVERGITETADFTGRFRPSASVQITSSVTGYLHEARF